MREGNPYPTCKSRNSAVNADDPAAFAHQLRSTSCRGLDADQEDGWRLCMLSRSRILPVQSCPLRDVLHDEQLLIVLQLSQLRIDRELTVLSVSEPLRRQTSGRSWSELEIARSAAGRPHKLEVRRASRLSPLIGCDRGKPVNGTSAAHLQPPFQPKSRKSRKSRKSNDKQASSEHDPPRTRQFQYTARSTPSTVTPH